MNLMEVWRTFQGNLGYSLEVWNPSSYSTLIPNSGRIKKKKNHGILLLFQNLGLLWAGLWLPSDSPVPGTWESCGKGLWSWNALRSQACTGAPTQGFLWLEGDVIWDIWFVIPLFCLSRSFLVLWLLWIASQTPLPSGFWLGLANGRVRRQKLGSLFSHPLPDHSFGNGCIFLLEAIGSLLCSFTSHWSSNALSSIHRIRHRGSKNFPLLSYHRHITVPCWTHNVGHSTHVSSLNSHNQPFDCALCFSREPWLTKMDTIRCWPSLSEWLLGFSGNSTKLLGGLAQHNR